MALNLQPLPWDERGTVLTVAHVMGLVYCIEHVDGWVRCGVAGVKIYEGSCVCAAKQAAHDDVLEKIEEIVGNV